jgi:DNA-binding NtrC family response regulator
VDDELVIADSLATVFLVNGYEAKVAYSVEGAVQVLSEWIPTSRTSMFDSRKSNGAAFAVPLQEQFPSCEVALFTGLSDLSDLLEKAHDAGHFFEVISKPIHPADILCIAARKLATLEGGEFSIA